MSRRLVVLWMLAVCTMGVHAQHVVPARSQVVAYDDMASLLKEQFHDSPYYLELGEKWSIETTDSSFRNIFLVDVEESWKDYQVYLNARGGKALRVIVNGKEVGYADDSRHWNEFLITPYLIYRKPNTLVVETMRHADGALLETADIPVGLNGTPYILFKNEPCVSDYALQADYDADNKMAHLSVDATVMCNKRKGKYYLEAELYDAKGTSLGRMGKWVVFKGRSEEEVVLDRSWNDLSPWSAESPVLYHVALRLRNEKMEQEELLGTHVGFRTIRIADGQMLVNGKAVTLKGVLYGQEYGLGADALERMLKDVVAMKANNINAVRTSHISPADSYFYDLCDRYGLYVVADANLMPISDQHMAVATNADYVPLFERRVQNLYGRFKNQTCIVGWSLGSTSDNGVCMAAAYKRLKALELYRPVLFAAAEYGESTDIIAPIHPDVKSLGQSLVKQEPRPCLILDAVSDNSFSSLEPLWRLVEQSHRLQGGFATWWPLPASQLAELKHLYSPFDVKMSKLVRDEGEFVVFNRNDFTGFGNNIVEYNVFTNMRPSITGGDLQLVVPVGGNDKATIKMPAVDLRRGEELFVRFDMRARAFDLSQGSVTQGTVVFPLRQGTERHETAIINGVADSSLLQTQVDLVFDGHRDWRCELAGELIRRTDENAICHDRMLRYVSTDGTLMCDVRCTHSVLGSGDQLFDYVLSPSDRMKNEEVRPMLLYRHKADSIHWFGPDRETWFSERNSGIVGIYSSPASTLDRQSVRWCALSQSEDRTLLEMVGERFEMKATKDEIILVPQYDTAFRLHVRALGSASPSEMAGYSYPRMLAGSLEPPVITASELHFSQPLEVSITSSQPCEIHYTTDGSEPTLQSPLYSSPLTISTTTVVKARAFAADMPPSFTSTRKFNYDYIVRTSFSRKPSTPYNIGADTLLFDGFRGSVDELNRGWVGFAGGEVAVTIQLARKIEAEYIVLRFAHAPDTWSFAPLGVKVALSADGVAYSDTVSADVDFQVDDADESEARVVELRIPLGSRSVGYLKVMPQTLTAIPTWHRGKGLKPWLMMDEIEVGEAIKN